MTDDTLKQLISQWDAEPPTDNRTDTICSDADLLLLARRIAEAATKADRWWDWDDAEYPIDDLNEWVDGHNGVGDVVRLHAAKRLPDEFYRVEANSDGEMSLAPATKAEWDEQRAINRAGGAS